MNPHDYTRSKEEIEKEIIETVESMNLLQRHKEVINRVPSKYRYQYVKALSSPTGKVNAMRMKCYECVGFESVSDRVGNCTCRLCPLWLHRPFQKAEEKMQDLPAEYDTVFQNNFKDILA